MDQMVEQCMRMMSMMGGMMGAGQCCVGPSLLFAGLSLAGIILGALLIAAGLRHRQR